MVVVLLVLVAVALGAAMRATRQERSFSAAPGAGGATAASAGDDESTSVPLTAEDSVAAEQAADILLGHGDLLAVGPDSMDLSPGQSVVLRNAETEVEVKPVRVTVGTDACADGPLVKVELSVVLVRGAASLSARDFTLLGSDGSMVGAIEACSAGFAELAPGRAIAFPATQPGRLRYGSDPAHPVAVWQLN
jgi:hypothetical protein